MGIVVVGKPKKKPLKTINKKLRRAVEVGIANEKFAEEEAAKKKKPKKKDPYKKLKPYRPKKPKKKQGARVKKLPYYGGRKKTTRRSI